MGLEMFIKIKTYLLLWRASGLRDSEKDMMNWTIIKGIAVFNSVKSGNNLKIFKMKFDQKMISQILQQLRKRKICAKFVAHSLTVERKEQSQNW
jgi:hypothetical protein